MIHDERFWIKNPALVNKINNMSNEELFKHNEKTDKDIVPYLFQEEYQNYINASNPNYGEGSKQLYKNLKDIKKEQFIIITLFNSDIKKEDLSKKKIQFVPFDKIFIQTSIPFVDAKNDFCVIDSVILIKDKKENTIHMHYIIKYVKDFGRRQIGYVGMREDELNLPIKNDEDSFLLSDYPGLERNEIKDTLGKIGNELRKLIRYISYKLTTHQYKSYLIYKKGYLVEKEIVYSSEVKSHKRHFWKDSGKFKIPLMKKEEWEEKGYETDEVVFKNNELLRNVPYVIIGNFQKNKELKKENRRISLIKKRMFKCEEKVYTILREIFPEKIIRRNDRRTLKGLELDFNIPELRLGIEYDGEQHFDKELYKKLYGDGFEAQVKRDKLKNKLCRKKNINLIRIKYDEKICKRLIINKLKEVGYGRKNLL